MSYSLFSTSFRNSAKNRLSDNSHKGHWGPNKLSRMSATVGFWFFSFFGVMVLVNDVVLLF